MPKSDIAFGSQFSPTQIDLPVVLDLVERCAGERSTLTAAIAARFFSQRPPKTNRYKGSAAEDLADNTFLALIAYGLIERDPSNRDHYSVTQIGRQLLEIRSQKSRLYELLAKHILTDLRGIGVLETVMDMHDSGARITVPDIARNLEERGIYVPEGGTHLNSMRQWLAKAGVIVDGWQISRARYEDLIGVTRQDLEALSDLTPEQRAFAKALALLDVDDVPSNKVADYAQSLYGIQFPAKGLPQEVLFALRDSGLITCEKTTTGRGAKPYIVRPTTRLRLEVMGPLLDAVTAGAGIAYRRLVRMRLTDVIEDLRSPSTHKKGVALEALALHLARLLDLRFVAWRLRGPESGGAEVDLIVEGTRLVFSRWQIQCKNTKSVNVDDVAKEVGLAFSYKSNVVMVVSTGRFTRQAKDFADTVLRDTNYIVVLLDGNSLESIKKSPSAIAEVLTEQARRTMAIKKLEM